MGLQGHGPVEKPSPQVVYLAIPFVSHLDKSMFRLGGQTIGSQGSGAQGEGAGAGGKLHEGGVSHFYGHVMFPF